MANEIPEQLRLFIFEHVDSVEMIEVLIYLRGNSSHPHSAVAISRELRSSEASISSRLSALHSIGLISEKETGLYVYEPASGELQNLVELLEQEYKLRRHRVLELVFSSVKRARPFADAFRVSKGPTKKDDQNG